MLGAIPMLLFAVLLFLFGLLLFVMGLLDAADIGPVTPLYAGLIAGGPGEGLGRGFSRKCGEADRGVIDALIQKPEQETSDDA